MAETSSLLRNRTLSGYRGFESLRLRHAANDYSPLRGHLRLYPPFHPPCGWRLEQARLGPHPHRNSNQQHPYPGGTPHFRQMGPTLPICIRFCAVRYASSIIVMDTLVGSAMLDIDQATGLVVEGPGFFGLGGQLSLEGTLQCEFYRSVSGAHGLKIPPVPELVLDFDACHFAHHDDLNLPLKNQRQGCPKPGPSTKGSADHGQF